MKKLENLPMRSHCSNYNWLFSTMLPLLAIVGVGTAVYALTADDYEAPTEVENTNQVNIFTLTLYAT